MTVAPTGYAGQSDRIEEADMAQSDDDIKAEGDEQLEGAKTEHLEEDPEMGPPPEGYGGKPGDVKPGGTENVRSTGRTVE